jgi:hypothetical protein
VEVIQSEGTFRAGEEIETEEIEARFEDHESIGRIG